MSALPLMVVTKLKGTVRMWSTKTVRVAQFSLQFFAFLTNSSILSVPSGENGSKQLRGRKKRNKMITNLIPEDRVFVYFTQIRVSRAHSSVHFVSEEGVLQTQEAAFQSTP